MSLVKFNMKFVSKKERLNFKVDAAVMRQRRLSDAPLKKIFQIMQINRSTRFNSVMQCDVMRAQIMLTSPFDLNKLNSISFFNVWIVFLLENLHLTLTAKKNWYNLQDICSEGCCSPNSFCGFSMRFEHNYTAFASCICILTQVKYSALHNCVY